MKSNLYSLHFVFSQKAVFRVPIWQRSYAWEVHQWRGLWTDALTCFNIPQQTHYIGSAVMHSSWSKVYADAIVNTIVDGQQRVTTLTALFLAIRDSLPTTSHHRSQIQYQFIEHQSVNPGSRWRLQLQDESNQASLIALQNGESPEAVPSSQFKRAYDFFRDKLEENFGSDEDRISAFMNSIGSGFEITWTELSESDNPHRIYQTINGSNVSLSSVDLVRNLFFLHIGDRGEEFFLRYWKPKIMPLEQQKGESGRFLQAWCVSRGLSGKDPHIGILSELAGKSRSEVFEYGAKLARSAEIYSGITAAGCFPVNFELDEASRSSFEWHNAWGTEPRRGLMLYLLNSRDTGSIDNATLKICLDIQASYLLRRFICGYEPNLHNSVFTALTKELVKEKQSGAAVPQFIRERLSATSFLTAWPRDQEVIARGTESNVYSQPRSTWVVLTLATINRGLLNNPKLAPSPAALVKQKKQVEHIMPQNIDKWIPDLTDWGVRDIFATHAKWLHTLGNLTLTAQNSSLGNDPFHSKQSKLKDERYAINDAVLSASVWTPEQILARAEAFTRLAIEMFEAPVTPQRPGEELEDFEEED
jgi:hypothetical protein